MPLDRVVAALGVPAGAAEEEIAGAMRALAGLSPQSADPALWIHLLDWFTLEVERPFEHQSSDMGVLGFFAGTWVVPRGDVSWTVERWGKELGVRPDRQLIESWLAQYVTEYLGPELSKAGLLRAQPYEQERAELPRS
jgi:hypothetical protein